MQHLNRWLATYDLMGVTRQLWHRQLRRCTGIES
jgi:hypothetical protein